MEKLRGEVGRVFAAKPAEAATIDPLAQSVG
jgi:hypothetical protein